MDMVGVGYDSVGMATGDLSEIIGVLASVMVPLLLVSLVLGIFLIIVSWKQFQKFGEAGWKCIIPFYSDWIEFKYIWGNGAFMFLLFIPGAFPIIAIIHCIKKAKAFGKNGGFAAGLIFLSLIFEAILAFGPAEYQGPSQG